MMRIQAVQMKALEAAQKQRFIEDTVERLSREHPDPVGRLGQAGTRNLVTQGVERGAGYGITEDEPLGRFIDLMLTLDPEFEKRPELDWTQDILADKELSGAAKMTLITDGLAEE